MSPHPTPSAGPGTAQTVGDLGERALIQRIEATAPLPPASVSVGIGDDAAVVEPDRGTLTVITTDALVEGVHFDRRFVQPADIGYKGLAVSLSDLAAMGAAPQHLVLSLALPPTFLVRDLDALVGSLLELGSRHRTSLIGGNVTSSSGPLFIDITAFGSVKRRRVLTRDGARPGDELYLSGDVGGAAAGLAWLQQKSPAGDLTSCCQRYLRPEPRVRLGTLLGRNRVARACIDLSDGLAEGIRQLAAAGRVGAIVDAAAVPIERGARQWFEQAGRDPVMASLVGGEDYELLFTVPATARRRLTAVQKLVKSLRLTRIGRVTKGRDLVLRYEGKDRTLPEGYEHFK